MKTIALKTEETNKYLSSWLLEESWNVNLNQDGLSLEDLTTGEKAYILDVNGNNAVLILNINNAPDNWRPRKYFYYPNQNLWEEVPVIEEPPEEEDIALTEESN
jgi:hypothetical protein